MRYVWITNELAQSPRPSSSEIDEIASVFNGVIVLLTPSEMSNEYIELLKSRGLSVLHKPTLDFHPVELYNLVDAVLFIDNIASRGGRVLVHCMGGIGRSSVVSVAYLLYKGLDLYTAVSYVRSKIPGALEVPWQLTILEDFLDLLSILGREKLSEFINELRKLGVNEESIRHLFKVFQLTSEFTRSTGIDKEILLNAILHVHTDELKRALASKLGIQASGGVEHPLIKMMHLLDYDEKSRVVVMDVDVTDPSHIVARILCDDDCMDIVNEAGSVIEELERVLNRRISLEYGDYTDYI